MKAKKSLGQHFLRSRRALAQIVGAAKIEKGETVLEVGSGKGALTSALLRAGAKVVAIEKDEELVGLLQEKFGAQIERGELWVVTADILESELRELGLRAGEFKIVANIPYYITGQFLRKFLSGGAQPKSMTLLLQREVVSRILARDGKESLLSLSVKAFGEPRLVGKVDASEFRPAPKVDSAIIVIENISRKKFAGEKISEEKFFALLHAGFAHKRKRLAKNLEMRTKISKKQVARAFADCKIAENARAEDLSLQDWLCLSPKL